MGSKGRHHLPTLYRPIRVLAVAAILLAFVAGIMVAALGEAVLAGDELWAAAFAAFAVADVLLYWWIAHALVTYAVNSGVYRDVDDVLELHYDDDEHDHHPGDA